MTRAVYFDQHVFRVSVKLIKRGIFHGVVGEPFELIDMCLKTNAAYRIAYIVALFLYCTLGQTRNNPSYHQSTSGLGEDGQCDRAGK